MKNSLCCSFVSGYADLGLEIEGNLFPSLVTCDDQHKRIYSYPFPRSVRDFHNFRFEIIGEYPLASAEDFKSLPRFGMTGLASDDEFVYAGSWNGVYKLEKKSLELVSLISHRLMCDIHGIAVHDGLIYSVLTGKDAIVITDMDGLIVKYFSIDAFLSVYSDEDLLGFDWRFLSKQYRGATGIWHFNYIQIIDGEIWLTARNLGCFVVVNTDQSKAHLRMINHKTPVLLHDGKYIDGQFFFTSIDGKIITAEPSLESSFASREIAPNISDFDRDMHSDVVRIEETQYAKQVNWCRGLERIDGVNYVTVDGRYDIGNFGFGILGLRDDGSVERDIRVKWSDVGQTDQLRYVTGFDVIAL